MKKGKILGIIMSAFVIYSCENEKTIDYEDNWATQDLILNEFMEVYRESSNISSVFNRFNSQEKPIELKELLSSMNNSSQSTGKTKHLQDRLNMISTDNEFKIPEVTLFNSKQYTNPENVYFAYSKNDTEEITAYDLNGNQIIIKSKDELDRPIFVFDDFGSFSFQHFLKKFNNVKTKINSKTNRFSRLILKRIELKDDHEPWHRGAAEIYGVQIGFNFDRFTRSKVPTFDYLDLSYLDHDNQVYYRNDIISYWWGQGVITNHIGLVIMEYDGNYAAFFDNNLSDLFRNYQFDDTNNNDKEKRDLKTISQRVARELGQTDDYVDQFYHFPNYEEEMNYRGKELNAKIRMINDNFPN